MTDLQLYYDFLKNSEYLFTRRFEPEAYKLDDGPPHPFTIINYAINLIKSRIQSERCDNIDRYVIISPNMYKLLYKYGRVGLGGNLRKVDETNKVDMQLVYNSDNIFSVYTHMSLPDYSPVLIGRDEAYNGSNTYFLNFTPSEREYSLDGWDTAY
jgi:hypothetical protein